MLVLQSRLKELQEENKSVKRRLADMTLEVAPFLSYSFPSFSLPVPSNSPPPQLEDARQEEETNRSHSELQSQSLAAMVDLLQEEMAQKTATMKGVFRFFSLLSLVVDGSAVALPPLLSHSPWTEVDASPLTHRGAYPE